MKIVNRIRETRRKKKVKMTFKSSSKRGCSYADSLSQANLHDFKSQQENKNTNNELSISSCGQTSFMTMNGKLHFLYYTYFLNCIKLEN